MLKGINRNVIIVRTPRSSGFEAAYFVLKREKRVQSEEKLIEEANKLIAKGERAKKKKRGVARAILWFAIGLVLGAAGALLAYSILL